MLFLAILFGALITVVNPAPAQADTCFFAGGTPCSCSGGITYGEITEAICSGAGFVTDCFSLGGGNWECFAELSVSLLYQTPAIDCVRGISGIKQDSFGNLLTFAGSYASVLTNGVSCGGSWARPAGWLQVRNQLMRWNGSAWTVCRDSGWLVSGAVATNFTDMRAWGVQPCGTGYYLANIGAYEYYAGSWNGGWTSSEWIYVS